MGYRENIPVYKKAIMRMKSVLIIGFLSMLAATGVVITSDSLAAHPDRVDITGTLHAKVTQQDSGKATEKLSMRVDVIDSIGNRGPSYPHIKPMNR